MNGHQDFTECEKLENYELGDSNAKIRISVPWLVAPFVYKLELIDCLPTIIFLTQSLHPILLGVFKSLWKKKEMSSFERNVREGNWFSPNNPNFGILKMKEMKDQSLLDGEHPSEKRRREAYWPGGEYEGNVLLRKPWVDRTAMFPSDPLRVPTAGRILIDLKQDSKELASEEKKAIEEVACTSRLERFSEVKRLVELEFEGESVPGLDAFPRALVEAMRLKILNEGLGEELALETNTHGRATIVSASSSPTPVLKLTSLKVIEDCDGRQYQLADIKGASTRIWEILPLIRMCDPRRLEIALEDEGLSFCSEKYVDLLSSQSANFTDGAISWGRDQQKNLLSSGHPFASSILLSGVRDLPVFEAPYLERFLLGKWKRDDYAYLSLEMFYRGTFDENDHDHLERALRNLERIYYVFHGDHMRNVVDERAEELRNPEWLMKPARYVRDLTEKSLSDFYDTLRRRYDRSALSVSCKGIPKSLRDPASGASQLLKCFLRRPRGNIDHLIYWQSKLQDYNDKQTSIAEDVGGRTKNSSYCLRDLVDTLCGGPLKCSYGKEKCSFTHVGKNDIDKAQLKENLETSGDLIKGLDTALRAKLLKAVK